MLTTVSGTVGGQLRQVSLYLYIYMTIPEKKSQIFMSEKLLASFGG